MVDQYMTIRQIADEAGVTDRTVRRWIADEQIPVYVRGADRRKFVNRSRIDHHIGLRLLTSNDEPSELMAG